MIGFAQSEYSVVEGEDLRIPFGLDVKGRIEDAPDTFASGVIMQNLRGHVTSDPVTGNPSTPDPEIPCELANCCSYRY